MEPEQIERGIARRSALIYLPIAVGAALLFLVVTGVIGGYPAVGRLGGAAWIGLLSLIVSMPIVITRVKARMRRRV